MITATAKPIGWGIFGESPAAITLDVVTDEVITKITRTDANGTAELIPNGANFMTTNYPGIGAKRISRTNLVTNPTFAVGVAGWDGYRAAVARATSTTPDTNGRLTVTVSEVGFFPRARFRLPDAGAYDLTYRARVRVATAAAGLSHRVAIGYIPPGGSVPVTAGEVTRAGRAGDLIEISTIVPAGSSTVELWAGMPDNAPIGSSVAFDQIMVQNSSGDYFDGGTPAAGGFKYEWTGTAHASTSQEYYNGWTVTDDAAALGPIRYTVTGASTTRTVEFDNTTPPLDRPVLINKPWNSGTGFVTVDQLTEYAGRRASGTTVHEVINADPLPTWGTPRRRRGSLGIWCRDYAQARAAESLVATGLWMIRQPTAGLDIVGFTIDTELTPVHKAGGATHWVLTLEYIERPQPVTGRFM